MHLLMFAKNIVEKMNVPFLSLDIADNNGSCELIEFQGIGFGPVTMTKSNFYFKLENGVFVKIETNSILEEEYANAIVWYIRKNDKDHTK